jgi:hypothetical protein
MQRVMSIEPEGDQLRRREESFWKNEHGTE